MSQAIPMRAVWKPLSTLNGKEVMARMEEVLQEWAGTPYRSGQKCKGVGADCIGFVFSIIDELDGRERAQSALLPPDAALHDRGGAFRAVAAMRRLYAPAERLRKPRGGKLELEPGDLLVVGTSKGGPGHIMIVGPRRNTIWHTTVIPGAHQAGWALGTGYERIYAVYRLKDRHRWGGKR
jgi:cell wall-associated NlpC family hydrolase